MRIGTPRLSFHSLPSTNSWLKDAPPAQAPPGTWVIADAQTAGRGQRGRSWESPPGANLTGSLLLAPTHLPATALFRLNQLAALAVRDALATWLPTQALSLKWPNDVLAYEQKIAGILIETTFTHQLERAILGIGINVGAAPAPEAVRWPATSLAALLPTPPSVAQVEAALLQALRMRYPALQTQAGQALQAPYEGCLYRQGQQVLFARPAGDTFSAMLMSVTKDGGLRLQLPSGRQEVVYTGEVQML